MLCSCSASLCPSCSEWWWCFGSTHSRFLLVHQLCQLAHGHVSVCMGAHQRADVHLRLRAHASMAVCVSSVWVCWAAPGQAHGCLGRAGAALPHSPPLCKAC